MRPQVSSTAAGHKTAAVRPCRCFLRRCGDGCDGARPIIRTAMERNCEASGLPESARGRIESLLAFYRARIQLPSA